MVRSWFGQGSLLVRSWFARSTPEVLSKYCRSSLQVRCRYGTATVQYFLSGTVYEIHFMGPTLPDSTSTMHFCVQAEEP